jgi:acetyl-CoA synthetase
MMLTRGNTYDAVYNAFRWDIPEFYNMADDVCDRHADNHPDKVALIVEKDSESPKYLTFADIRRDANRMANWLVSAGLKQGDRVSILLSQQPEAAITHVACWKAGMVSSPMSILFGPDAIGYRLKDLGSRVVVTDLENLPKIRAVADQAPGLAYILVVDGAPEGCQHFLDVIDQHPDAFDNVRTRADDLAFITYTSGTTGNPKGAMQPHRSVLGHTPGFEFIFDFAPDEDDVVWSLADWSWLAGLMNILMVGWFHGSTVLATAKIGFDPEQACRLMHQHRVTRAMLTPTMLKLLRQNPKGLMSEDIKV